MLEDLLEKYPPTLPSSVSSKNIIIAYQELIGEYPELLLFPSFARIYLPYKTASRIADDILSQAPLSKKMRRERSKERGLSHTNNLLLDAERILSHPDELIKRYKCTISKNKFRTLLLIAHKRKEAGESIDHFFIEHHYADNLRKLIAYSLYVIYEVGIMFREELYKDYKEKTKTIKKMPEADEYYQYAQKLKVPIRGKQTKRATIVQDAKDYRKNLTGILYDSDRDRHFYQAKRFRYLTVLVIEINNFFKKDIEEPPKEASYLRNKSKDNYRFSVDNYLNEAMNTPRPTRGVMLIDLPSIKLSAKGHCTQTQ